MRGIALAVLVGLFTTLSSCWAQGEDALTVAARQVADQFVQSADAKRGEVADVDATTTPVTIYVLLGQKDRIQEGNVLNVVAKGDPIVVNGETVGFKERPVGTAEITRIQSDKLSVATMKTTVAGQQPEKGCLAYLKPVPGTLAVSTFLRPDKMATLMGQEFADKLATALQGTTRFTMVERSRLEAALAEDKLGLNDLFDPAKTAPLGSKLQAKGVVLGSVTQENDRYTVSVRVVDIETGTVVCTATTTCRRSDELDRKYVQTITAAGTAGGGGDGDARGRRVLYIGSGRDMASNEALVKLLAEAGFVVEAKSKSPSSASEYDVCIIAKGRGETAGLGIEDADIRNVVSSMLSSGKGVVLLSFAGWTIGGWSGHDGSSSMGDMSSMIGCSAFWYNQSGLSLKVARTNAFGGTWNLGSALFSTVGDRYYPEVRPDQLEASATPIAQIMAANGRTPSIGAFANTYGEGRLYWQAVSSEPNYPQLGELLIGGVKWVAHLTELDGSKGFR